VEVGPLDLCKVAAPWRATTYFGGGDLTGYSATVRRSMSEISAFVTYGLRVGHLMLDTAAIAEWRLPYSRPRGRARWTICVAHRVMVNVMA
jgi:hypothetical protein